MIFDSKYKIKNLLIEHNRDQNDREWDPIVGKFDCKSKSYKSCLLSTITKYYLYLRIVTILDLIYELWCQVGQAKIIIQ